MQKAGRYRFWQINDDLVTVNKQIEGQLGHTLVGGKEKKKEGGGKKN